MNETGKTVAFVTAAVVAVAVGVWSHIGPAESDLSKEQLVGKSLFADLNPEAARSLEIIEYDPDTATLKPFKVAQEGGIWRIPSHEDYPADASQQLGEAAAALAACETINIASDERSSHATYGVIDPDPKSLTSGTTGVGKRVNMEDGSGQKLAQVIIGKAIKDKPDLHYVREANKDTVYVVKLKTDKFSTKFEDWIEKDLLKLSSWDIERVSFNDYSIDELQGAVIPRAKIQVAYDSKDSKWNLDELEVFREGDYEPETMAADEELNSQKLNDLKNALDDLKIVDVARKPEGLAADLRAGEELAGNRDAKTSLMQRGFYLASVQGGELGIYSNEGEIRCATKEGVEYMLRFGRISGGGESEAKTEENEDSTSTDDDAEKDKKETGANRFIMVTAQFNEDLLAKPELTPLPGEKSESETTEGKDDKDDAEKTSAIRSTLSEAAGLLAQADEGPAEQEANPSEEKKSTSEKPAGAKSTKRDKTDAKGPKDKEAKPEVPKPKTPEELERDRINKENERKQKEYNDKVKKGKEKVKELSDRFADWYYVVSDSTYRKIHLGRDEIIKKKTPPADEKKSDAHEHDEEGSKDVLDDKLKSLPE